MLVDANLLVYAVDADDAHHQPARRWLEDALNGTERVGLPWESLTAFVRLTTNPRVRSRPLTSIESREIVSGWLDADGVWVPQPTRRHAEILGQLLAGPGVTANLVPDAHLAAIAVGHGLTLCSADSDFARFGPALRWRNPLATG